MWVSLGKAQGKRVAVRESSILGMSPRFRGRSLWAWLVGDYLLSLRVEGALLLGGLGDANRETIIWRSCLDGRIFGGGELCQ